MSKPFGSTGDRCVAEFRDIESPRKPQAALGCGGP
jgi:hypothetical protein